MKINGPTAFVSVRRYLFLLFTCKRLLPYTALYSSHRGLLTTVHSSDEEWRRRLACVGCENSIYPGTTHGRLLVFVLQQNIHQLQQNKLINNA